MKHYMVFLTNGQTVHVWADKAIVFDRTQRLSFIANHECKALFDFNHICGYMCCDKEGDEE